MLKVGELSRPRTAPHGLFFFLYNFIYYLPLLLVFLWGYGQGGGVEAVGIDGATMSSITLIYGLGICGFVLGTLPLSLLRRSKAQNREARPDRRAPLRVSDKLLVAATACALVLSKIALIPLGIYHDYAFSTGQMNGGIWTLSTFISETMVLMGTVVLVSGSRHKRFVFCFLVVLNCINLLHGTRIFFIVSVTTALVYAQFRGYVTARRLLVYGPIMAISMLLLTYVVFLSRSDVSLDGAFGLARIVSPIVYESLFSQWSLVNLLRSPDLWSSSGHFTNFFSDIVINSTPRVLLPDKDALLFFSKYDVISPLGGMSGYCAGLIYFGWFFPGFYFALGMLASWLYEKARGSWWWLVVYIYFTGDFLFRISRDGYLIPIKMLINGLQIIVILVALRILFRRLAVREFDAPKDSSGVVQA